MDEADHRRSAASGRTRFLAGSRIEIVREPDRAEAPRHVLFDFDGTLSLIREGWPEVMVPMMVEILLETGTAESEGELRRKAHTFVMELNGKQTIYQMIRLAREVAARGGKPLDPLAYKHAYHERLMARIRHRRDALESGRTDPRDMLVPCSYEILDALRERGVSLYLASGTDEKYVLEEARLLGLDKWFGRHIYGAIDDYARYSKAMVIERLLRENKVDGTRLAGFGDGYVEIENIKAVHGLAVAVASNESERDGSVDRWKRDRLTGVGADIVIPDYREHRRLLSYIWNGGE